MLATRSHENIAPRTSLSPARVSRSRVLKRLGLAGPFFGPVTMTITESSTVIDRSGDIIDCILKLTGLSCRQF